MYVLRHGQNPLYQAVRLGLPNLCYTCGICVGDCPAARFSDDFNPRQIFLRVSLGIADGLIAEQSPIWKCTTCYTCAERCPAGVKPVEVIIALRNMCFQEGIVPHQVSKIHQAVVTKGIVSALTETILRRRRELGLPEVSEDLGAIVKSVIGEDG